MLHIILIWYPCMDETHRLFLYFFSIYTTVSLRNSPYDQFPSEWIIVILLSSSQQMEVSKNGGSPLWIVYFMENAMKKDDITTIRGNLHMTWFIHVGVSWDYPKKLGVLFSEEPLKSMIGGSPHLGNLHG